MTRILTSLSVLLLVAACSKNKPADETPVGTTTSTTEVEGPGDPSVPPADQPPAEPAKPAPTYLHGKWIWFDLQTTDVEKAKAFYTTVFGWKVNPMPMGDYEYQMLMNGETGIGGIVLKAKENKAPSHWVGYVSVADVDGVVAKVPGLGGKVLVPGTDIPNVGRFAVIQDPQGAVFNVMRSAEGDMPDGDMHNPPKHSFFWHELMTSDVEAAVKFYGEAVGYGHQAMPMPGADPKKKVKEEYHMFTAGEMPRAGMMKTQKKQPTMWLPYVIVDDVDATLKAAKGAGGKVQGKAFDIPTVGRIGMIVDPTGAMIAVMKPSPHHEEEHGKKAEPAKQQ